MLPRLAFTVLLLLPVCAEAQVIWDGGAGTSLWSDAANWDSNTLPGTADTVFFTGASPFGISLNGNRSVTAVWFTGNSAYTLSGSTLTLSDTTPLFVQAPTSGSVTHTISSIVSLTGASAQISVQANGTLLFNGQLTASGLLDKIGTGTVIVNSGATALSGARVQNGTLQIGNGGTTGAISGDIQLTNAAATLAFNRSDAVTYTGVISGTSGSVTKSGAGTLVLTGTNTHTGTLTINGGNVSLGGALTSGTWAGNIANNGNLIFNQTTDQMYAKVISGTGSIFQVAATTLTLSGSNTYSGNTNLQGGTVVMNHSAALGTSAVVFNGGALTWGTGITTDISAHTVTISSGGATVDTGANNVTFANGIGNNGSGGLTKAGTGTLTLAGTSTFTGATTVSGGTLSLGTGGTTGSIATDVSLSSGTTLQFNRSDAITFANTISGSGNVTKLGTNTLTFTGDNTSTGTLTISGGSMKIGAGGATGSWIGDISNGGSLIFDSTTDATCGAISGAGSVTKNGSNTLSLTGADTHGGTLSVNSGTLSVGTGGTTGSIAGNVSVASGATLQFYRDDDIIYGGVISGAGRLWNEGQGKVSLTGANALSGTATVNYGTLSIGNGGTTGSLAVDISVINAGALEFNRSDNVTFSNVISGTSDVRQRGTNVLTLTGTNTHTGLLDIFDGTVSIGAGGTAGSWSGNINIDGALIFNRSDSLTFGGVISGGGTMEKKGANTLTLTGASTFYSTLTITAGTVSIGSGGTAGSWSGNISNNNALIFNRSDASTYSGVISGSGSVTKQGAGTLSLTGTSTTTTPFIISAGTLSLGNGGTAGAWSGDISNGAALIFNRSDATTYNGVISGAGTVTKQGTGTLSLTGTNTSTGALTVSAGTLSIGAGGTAGSIAGDAAVSTGAVLQFNRSDDFTYSGAVSGAGTLSKAGTNTLSLTGTNTVSNASVSAGTLSIGTGGTAGSLAADVNVSSGATLLFNRSDAVTFANAISGGGNVTKNGSSKLTLTGASTGTGTLTVNAGSLQIGSGSSGSYAGNINFGTKTVSFGRNDNYSYAGVLTATSGTLTQAGAGTVTLTGSGHNIGSSIFRIFGGVTTGSGVTASLGNLTVGTGGTFTAGASSAITFLEASMGDFGGTCALAVGSAATVACTDLGLATSNGSTGVVTVTGGTLSINGDLYRTGGNATSTATITISGGGSLSCSTVSADGSVTAALNNGTFTIKNADDNNMLWSMGSGGGTLSNANAVTLNGSISGSGSLTKTGAGTLTIANDDTQTGGININAGTLSVGTGGTTGSIATSVSVSSGATLQFNRSDSITYGGGNVISGAGNLAKLGAGTVYLSDANTLSGTATVSAGTLSIGAGGTTGSLNTSISVSTGATLQFMRSDVLTFDKVISGGGDVANAATGMVILTGTNTNTGTLTITSGTVQIGNGGTTGTWSGNISTGTDLIFNRSDSVTFAGVISGTGNTTNAGAGTLILTGVNTSTGTLNINAGTVQVGNGGATESISYSSVVNNSTLAFKHSNSSTTTFAGVISGSGPVTVGGGTLYLTGDSTDTGLMTISGAGTVYLGDGGTTGSYPGSIKFNGGIIRINRSNDFTYPGVLTGTGQLGKSGSGTVTLTGSGHNLVTADFYLVAGGVTTGAGVTGHLGYPNLGAGATLTIGSGNTITSGGIAMGNFGGTSTLILGSGSTYTCEDDLGLAGSNGSVGVLTINGGSFIVLGGLYRTGGSASSTATLTVDGGGSFSAATTSADGFVTATLNNGSFSFTSSTSGSSTSMIWVIASGGGTISNAAGVTLSGAMSGSGVLTKTGAGTLTLSGTHTRTGDTVVSTGTLSMSSAALADAADVYLASGTTLNLGFTGSDTIDEFYIGGVRQIPGTWGGLTSSAPFKTDRITGSGMLVVNGGTISSFASWAAAYGLTGASAAFDADPDHDGLANGLEFALGSNPTVGDSSSVTPSASLDSNYLTLSFQRSDASEGLATMTVEYGTDLTNWTSVAIGSGSSTSGGVIVTVTENGSAADTLTVQIPRGSNPLMFGRVKVAQ